MGVILLNDISYAGGGSGSGGSSSYTELSDKPTINGHTVVGDMTGDDLGLVDENDCLTEQQINNLIALL